MRHYHKEYYDSPKGSTSFVPVSMFESVVCVDSQVFVLLYGSDTKKRPKNEYSLKIFVILRQ